MTSLVSDFIINPVLRQARRFSRSSTTTVDSDTANEKPPTKSPLARESLLSEGLAQPAIEPDGPSTAEAPGATSSPIARSPTLIDTPEAIGSNPTSPASDMAPRDTYNPMESAILSSSPPLSSALVDDEGPEDHIDAVRQAYTPSPFHTRSTSLPEDDGMGPMRRKIIAVQSLQVPPEEKALLLHKLLTERYVRSRSGLPVSSGLGSRHRAGQTSWEQEASLGTFDAFKFWQSTFIDVAMPQKFVLTADDVKPTYSTRKDPSDCDVARELDETERPLGCPHYQRNVKLQCSTCGRWYTCRLCHDAVEDHALIRKETRHMLCMLCGCAQKAAEACVRCGELAATYYCNICKLWDTDRPTYHCPGCGICRRGLGLGKDFFHCNTCGICKPMSVAESHKCIERSTDCDCPICGEYMFTSRKRVIYLDACAHSIHEDCYTEHMKTSYKCPICYKSAVNMEAHFRNLDIEIQQQPMPPEFQDTKAVILCNDCCAKTSVKYHWLGLKCAVCRSYNTVELQIIGRSPHTQAMSRETSGSRRPTLAWTETPVRPRSTDGPVGIDIASNPFSLSVEDLQDRYARSMSPSMMGLGPAGLNTGFLGSDQSEDEDDEAGEDESSESDDDDDNEEEDNYDDDDPNEITLFGHR